MYINKNNSVEYTEIEYFYYIFRNRTIRRIDHGLKELVEGLSIQKGALLTFVKDHSEENCFQLFYFNRFNNI